ncbi:MAG: tetratricopeptide repeat protein [Syntrophomonas sp.]
MKFCAKCGKEMQDDAQFCGGCGYGVEVVPASDNKSTFGSSPLSHDAPLTPVPKPKSGLKTKIIMGLTLAILIVVGGLWGWNNFGTEARMQAKLDLAVKYLSENDYEKAVLAFNDAIKIDPKEVKAYQGLARTYTIQGKYDEAQSTYDKGLAAVAAEKKPTLQIGLAGMYIDQGQLDKAEQAFQEINNSNSSCLEAYFGLAVVYQQKGDNAKAEAMLRKAVENNPNEYRAYNALALYLKQNNKTDDSFNNLVKSLSLEINQQEAYLILTDLYKGNWDVLQSKASLIKDKQLAAMLQFYGYYASEDYTKAITTFQEKLSQQSSNQKARILAAIAMLKQGDKPGAETLVKQLTKEKLNDWLLSDLAKYHLEAGDKDKAQEYALKALKSNPTNLDAIALLQTINSPDASAKVFTAQALLYNWKPVIKVKEELITRSLLNPEIVTNNNISKAENKADTNIQLTPDYWIPDLNKKYVYIINNKTETTDTWIHEADGSYTCKRQDSTKYWSSNQYAIQDESVTWMRDGGNDGLSGSIQSGIKYVLKPVVPGQGWENTYNLVIDAVGIREYRETCTFVGMEKINVMGNSSMAAHIHVNRTKEFKGEEDYWLIKNMGVVKKTTQYSKSIYIEELININ